MTADSPAFALNHMSAPRLSISDFFDLAEALGVVGVEIRNDIQDNAIGDGTPPAVIARAAQRRNLRILSINAVQRFNAWDKAREEEARLLIDYAGRCGAEALVLVPANDGSGRANGERQANLRIALKGLRPILADAGITGLVEPLGFEMCSLRYKSEAVEAIESLNMGDTFRIVHDTFHHHLAGEDTLFADHTGLVHISGVTDGAIATAQMRDNHRVLVDEHDRLGNTNQVAALLSAGYGGPFSFEPFSDAVHLLPDLRAALAGTMAHIRMRSQRQAA